MGFPEPVTNPGPACQLPYAAFEIKKSFHFEKKQSHILNPAAFNIEKYSTKYLCYAYLELGFFPGGVLSGISRGGARGVLAIFFLL